VGDRTAPCGTPARIGEMLEISEPELTAKQRSLSKILEEVSKKEVGFFLICIIDRGARLCQTLATHLGIRLKCIVFFSSEHAMASANL